MRRKGELIHRTAGELGWFKIVATVQADTIKSPNSKDSIRYSDQCSLEVRNAVVKAWS